jgi:hypothetical protein
MMSEDENEEREKFLLMQAAQANDGWYLYETNITLDENGVHMFKLYKHPNYPWTRTNHYYSTTNGEIDTNKSKELFEEMRLAQEWL